MLAANAHFFLVFALLALEPAAEGRASPASPTCTPRPALP